MYCNSLSANDRNENGFSTYCTTPRDTAERTDCRSRLAVTAITSTSALAARSARQISRPCASGRLKSSSTMSTGLPAQERDRRLRGRHRARPAESRASVPRTHRGSARPAVRPPPRVPGCRLAGAIIGPSPPTPRVIGLVAGGGGRLRDDHRRRVRAWRRQGDREFGATRRTPPDGDRPAAPPHHLLDERQAEAAATWRGHRLRRPAPGERGLGEISGQIRARSRPPRSRSHRPPARGTRRCVVAGRSAVRCRRRSRCRQVAQDGDQVAGRDQTRWHRTVLADQQFDATLGRLRRLAEQQGGQDRFVDGAHHPVGEPLRQFQFRRRILHSGCRSGRFRPGRSWCAACSTPRGPATSATRRTPGRCPARRSAPPSRCGHAASPPCRTSGRGRSAGDWFTTRIRSPARCISSRATSA